MPDEIGNETLHIIYSARKILPGVYLITLIDREDQAARITMPYVGRNPLGFAGNLLMKFFRSFPEPPDA